MGGMVAEALPAVNGQLCIFEAITSSNINGAPPQLGDDHST
jgi:hypothetical protein